MVGCLAALIANVIVGTSATPHAHWTIMTIFTVSQSDAGATLRKSAQRVVGTLVGGLAGILAVVAFADLPAFYVPVLAAVVAAGVFASLTTTAPYVMLLGTLTFVLVAFFPPGGAAAAVEFGFWRVVAIVIGVICGTGAQVLLWPDDPETKLREALAARLATVARAVRALAGAAGHAGAPPAALSAGDLAVQLDLLNNAEARHPSLRRRHTEQLALIVEVDRLLTTAVWLAGAGTGWVESAGDARRRQLEMLGEECARLSEALAAGRPPSGSPLPDIDEAHAGDVPALRPLLQDMTLALGRVREAMGFLDPDRPAEAEALDRPARAPLLTPAFSTDNREAMALTVKSSLALAICYVLMHALHWPAMLTAGVTAVLVAQTSFGAIVQKSALRLGGAVLGGALGLAVVLVAMPNLENLGALLAVSAVGYGIAAWITAGSSRISYMGIQTGMAFAIAVTDPGGPTTDLAPARDRVLGIVIGLLIVLVVDAVLRPARARFAMWSALARALRSIASLARLAPETRPYRAQLEHAVRFRSAVYQDLAATLRLSVESEHEPDARESEEERRAMARLCADAQAVFLAVLALIRHRLAPGFPTLPPPVQEAMRRLDDGVAETLESLAERLGRASARPLPDLGERVAALEGLIPLAPSPTAGAPVALAVAERDHAMIARDLVDRVAVLREAVDAAPRGPARSRAS